MSLEPDDNTKWLGWRIGTALDKQTEEISELNNSIRNLQKTMIEISVKLSDIIESDQS
jgi:hypothetical protein